MALVSWTYLLTLADDSLVPVAGQGGWVGAGMLGAVLSWLLFVHLPAKDKQIRELVASKDETVRGLLENFDQRHSLTRAEFLAQLETQRSVFLQILALLRDGKQASL